MQICQAHWTLMREAIDRHGLSPLVARDGEQAGEAIMADLRNEPDPKHERFDPLMSMNFHWMNSALANGGLYLMFKREDGANGGHYCPVCEYEIHAPAFEAASAIDEVAVQIAAWCREQGLIALTQ